MEAVSDDHRNVGELRNVARSSVLRGIMPFTIYIESRKISICCINISIKGICFTCPESIPKETKFDLVLDDNGNSHSIKGKIVRQYNQTKNEIYYGAEFIEQNQEKYTEILESEYLLLKKANILINERPAYLKTIKIQAQRCFSKSFTIILHLFSNATMTAIIVLLWSGLAMLTADGDDITKLLHMIERISAIIFFIYMNASDIISLNRR